MRRFESSRKTSLNLKIFKPRSAFSTYHRGDDLIELTKFLLKLNPNYRFYLRHCGPSWPETVLYSRWKESYSTLHCGNSVCGTP